MSQTATQKRSLLLVKQRVLKTTGKGQEAYNEMLFLYGVRFAEGFSRMFLNHEEILVNLLQNPEYGFWKWWKVKWMLDDQSLVATIEDNEDYEELKACMTDDSLYQKELYHLINHLI